MSSAGQRYLGHVLNWLSPIVKDVVLVPGNHEYYTIIPRNPISSDCDDKDDYQYYLPLGMYQMRNALQQMCFQFKNVHLLIDSSVVIGNIKFIGSTMWSNPPAKHWDRLASDFNDFGRIFRYAGSKFTPKHMVKLHEHSVRRIKKQLDSKVQLVTVVVTHFCPMPYEVGSRWSPTSRDEVESSFYYSDVRSLVDHQVVNSWIYGHTHEPIDMKLPSGARILNNPYVVTGKFRTLLIQ